MSEKRNLRCSFCGKSEHEVKLLIAATGVHICDECVALCAEIIQTKAIGDGFTPPLTAADVRRRDEFAGQAMSGMLAAFKRWPSGGDADTDRVAAIAYRQADAMRKARVA